MFLDCLKLNDQLLNKINFIFIQQLYIDPNKSSNTNIFERLYFKQLQQLNLSYNKISIKNNSSVITYLKSKISKFYYDKNNHHLNLIVVIV